MALEPGGRVYRSNVCNDIKTRLGSFVVAKTDIGAVLLKELLQNADDAGATDLVIALDERPAPAGLANPLAEFLGPALVVANNGPFKDEHFKAIVEVASGQKLGDSVATGRFGVGFTSVFLVGDVCALCSERSFILFDLTRRVLPTWATETDQKDASAHEDIWVSNAGNEGWAEPNQRALIRHAVASDAFSKLSIDLGNGKFLEGLKGSLGEGVSIFRIPLRVADDKHGDSLYSERFETPERRRGLVEEMKNEAAQSLVFLRHVERVTFVEFGTQASSPRTYSVSPWPADVREFFSTIEQGAGKCALTNVRRTVKSPEGALRTYIVALKVDFTNNELREIREEYTGLRKYVPETEVALCVSGKYQDTERWRVLLPLSTSGPSAALCHGGFFVDQARHGPTFREKSRGGETGWNNALVKELTAPLLRELLKVASDVQPCDEAFSIRLIRNLPQYSAKKATSLSEFFSKVFYHADWSVKVTDARGDSFKLSKGGIYPDKPATGMLLQELDDVLGNYVERLPSIENQRPVRYVSPAIFEAVVAKFNRPNWCRPASKVDSGTILKLLKDTKSGHSRESLDALVRRLEYDESSEPTSLSNAALFWSSGKPVLYDESRVYVLSGIQSSGAFHEVIEKLGLKIDGLVRVDEGIGAGDVSIAQKLELSNVRSPDDETLLRLLKRVTQDENRHNRFDPKELWEKTTDFRKLLENVANRGPKEFDSKKLAWMVCTEGGSEEVEALNEVVVVRTDQHEETVRILWDSFLSAVCPRIHHQWMDFHSSLQNTISERVTDRVTAFDQGDVRLVRTRPKEILVWLGELYRQRGIVERQTQVVKALGKVIETLESKIPESKDPTMGADALIEACAGLTFHANEFDLLCCLPVHRTPEGERVALGVPDPMLKTLPARQNDIRRRFRLQPPDTVDTVPEPPGITREFKLLSPPPQIRFFYQKKLGIQPHTPRLAVLDLLEKMAEADDVPAALHLERLRYLAAKVSELEETGDAEDKEKLKVALEAARLVPCIDGHRRAADAIDVDEAVTALEKAGWKPPEAKQLASVMAAPKGVASYNTEARNRLEVLRALPERIGPSELARLALESSNEALNLPNRVRVLAAFHGQLLKTPPKPSAEFLRMVVPTLAGGQVALCEAELLPRDCFGLSAGLVAAFFQRALDAAKLAESCGVNEEDLRSEVLPLLTVREVAFPTAAKRIRDEFSRCWPGLSHDEQLELLKPSEGGEGTRWSLMSDHLLGVAAPSLAETEAAGGALDVFRRLAELVCHMDRDKLESEELHGQLVFPCRDGRFHLAGRCWFSKDIDLEVKLAAGSEYVVESSTESEKLRGWMGELRAAQKWDLEELFPARLASKPKASDTAEPASLFAWQGVLKLLGNPASKLRQTFSEVPPRATFDWELRRADLLKVHYVIDGDSKVVPDEGWHGPPVVAEAGVLWLRSGAVPGITESRRVREYDQRVARELLLGIGLPRDNSRFDELLEAILSELDRPGDELERLRKRRSDRLIERYAELNADQKFAVRYREWERLDKNSSEAKRLRKELEDLTKAGMVEARRRAMEELGYSIENFYAEMAQNAEDACIQREVLGMGPPAQATLTFHRDGDELRVEHFGRPFNYWRHGDRIHEIFRDDIERITSDRGSFKQQGDGPAVIGRFGVGFKCVYWLTDRPRIHSHIWHFEIESTCIPKQVDEPADLPEGVTRVVLPLRPERLKDRLPEARDALGLLLFTRVITAVTMAERQTRRTLLRCSGPVAGGSGELLDFTVEGQPLARFLRLAGEGCYLAIELDQGTRLPKRRIGDTGASAGLPDTFAVFPLSGVRHRLGVAISARFSLQSGRSNLAVASASENERAMAAVGSMLEGSAAALSEAAIQPGVRKQGEWFKSFWLLWDFDATPDSVLQPLVKHVAKGLAGLCRASDVVPRWDGELRAVGPDCPVGDYDPTVIPKTFARALASALTAADRVAPRVPASSRYAVDHDLAVQLRRVFEIAGEDNQTVQILDWAHLAEFFQGQGSMFGVRPELLNILAEALWNPTENKWRCESMRAAAAAAIREAWLPTADGNVCPTKEIADVEWFEEREAPAYVLETLTKLASVIGKQAQQLLRGAGLKDDLSWTEFRDLMVRCPSFDDARRLLKFLCNAGFWKSWDPEKATMIREEHWVPRDTGRLPLSADACRELLSGVSNDFLKWLGGTSASLEVESLDSGSVQSSYDPKEVLEAICKWWRDDHTRLIREYEAALYPGGAPADLSWQPGDDLDRRRAWVTLFVLSMSQTLGWTTTAKQRRLAEKLIQRGFMDVFADGKSGGNEWIRLLDEFLLGRLNQNTGFKHWIQLFWRIRAMAKPENLDVYLSCLGDATKTGGGRHHPREFLNPRNSPIGQSRDDVPDGAWALGIGASFLWRELCRRGLLSHKQFDRYCFVPKASVRKLVERITGLPIGYHTGQSFEASAEISDVLQKTLDRSETFERCYDIPLLLLSEDTTASKSLREKVLGRVAPELVDFRADEPEDPLSDAEERDGFWIAPPPRDRDTGWRTLPDGRRVLIG